jgi:hypothetical protein
MLVAHLPREPDELVEHRRAARKPERRALGDVREGEQAELRPQAPVVARLGLLEAREVLGQLVLGEERGPVDAGEHLARRVAAPVGARDGLQLERLDALGRRGVRPAAQVGERPVGVQGHGVGALVADDVLDELDLVVLALGAVALEGLRGGDLLAHERLVGLDVGAHLLLDAREVGVRQVLAVGQVDVVVEALLDRRADGDLHPGVQLEHGRGEDVRGVVADEVQRVLPGALGHDLQRLAGQQRHPEVADLSGLLDGERRLGQAGADGRRGVGARGAVREVEGVAVGEGDLHATAS